MAMNDFDKAIKTGRRLTRDGARAANTALSGGEMMQAAGDVINARLEIMAAGLANPGKADMTEISLMSSEKVEALSASAATLARNFGDLGGRLSQSALEEVGFAARAATALSSAPTPTAFASAQYSYAVNWWGRVTGQMLTLNTELLKAQADALKPIHATTVANAKRLKR